MYNLPCEWPGFSLAPRGNAILPWEALVCSVSTPLPSLYENSQHKSGGITYEPGLDAPESQPRKKGPLTGALIEISMSLGG